MLYNLYTANAWQHVHATFNIPTLTVHVYLYSCVDAVLDRAITPNSDQYIVWAVGPRGTEDGLAYYHAQRTPNLQTRLRFGRTAADNCTALSCPSPPSCPYAQETFDVTNMDATFVAVIGQSGGPRGYEGVTGETQLPTALLQLLLYRSIQNFSTPNPP